MNLCPFLSRASSQQQNLLLEAVVANPDAIERYVSKFIHRTTPQIGRNWFAKKLRAALLNTPALLRPVTEPSSDYPPYANDALDRGEPVYVFDPRHETLAQAASTYAHLADWFNALDEVANRKADNAVAQEDALIAKRELSKIMHYDPQQATERADKWFAHMGTRAKGDKAGVEIVLQWPDGYYAVRYTDKNTMMRDGTDLQNCLAQGYYWDNVASGAMSVYGIRQPSDEAVVGIRIVKGEIAECKGKQNQPVSAPYRPYCIDLFNHMGVKPGQYSHDLDEADIYYNEGRYGDFKTVAKLVIDEQGLKVWRTDDQVMATYEQYELTAHISRGVITQLVPNSMPTDVVIMTMNAIGLPPPSPAAYERYGLFYNTNAKQYGKLEDMAKPVGRSGSYAALSLGDRFLLTLDGKAISSTDVEGGKLAKVGFPKGVPVAAMLMFLNSTGKPPSVDVEIYLRNVIAYDGSKYGSLKKLGKPIHVDGGVECLQIADLPKWLIKTGENTSLLLRGGASLRIVNWERTDRIVGAARKTIAYIIRHYGFKRMPDEQLRALGGIVIGDTIALDLTDLFNNFEAAAKQWTESDEDVPLVRLSDRFDEFLGNHNGHIPNPEGRIGQMIAKYMVPQQTVGTRIISERHVFDQVSREISLIFPQAALELCRRLRMTPPTRVIAHAKKGVKQAVAFMAKHPLDIFETAFRYDELSRHIYKHNAQVHETISDTLEKSPSNDLSSRFAALNALQRTKR